MDSLEELFGEGRPKVIDLFGGVGGLSLGFEMAGFNVVAGVELDDTAGRYAQYNFPRSRIYRGSEEGDIAHFSASSYRADGGNPSSIFMIIGGPPCQGFSLAGRRNNDDPLNALVMEFARVVLDFDPPAFLMENVPGLETSGSGMLSSALATLSEHYDIHKPTTLKAWEYGVPQMRKRLFLLGIRRDLRIKPSLPQRTHYRPIDAQSLLLKRCPTCWEAISDIPDADLYDELISGDTIAYESPPQNDYQRIMRAIDRDSDLSTPVVWDDKVCTNLRRTSHGEDLLSRFSSLRFGEADKSSGIRRLDPKDISTTIRAGTTKARGSWSAPRPLHPYRNRVLTTRECARIQSFPDWFRFHPVKWHGNRQVGNAVPPLLAKALASHVRGLFCIPRPQVSEDVITRDFSLIAEDIEKARRSNYEGKKVSHSVTSWSKKS